MKKLLIILALLPTIAAADPSISSDAGRSIDNSQSNSIKNDKSLSADKSRGQRHADSDSRERAREQSLSRSHSEKIGSSAEKSRSGSVDLNINTVLLKEFVNRYERTQPQQGMQQVQKVFASCKPLSGIVTEYPTLNSSISAPTGGGAPGTFDENDVVPRRLAYHFAKGTGGQWGNSSDSTALQESYNMPSQNEEVGKYARCRIIASKWVAEAGERLGATTVRSEAEVRDRIDQAFTEMENDQQVFEQIRGETMQLWQSAECAPTLQRWPDFSKPNLICQGVIEVDGNSIIIENQETLSAGSIAGRSYKIAINSSENQSVGMDDSISKDARTSRSERAGDSNERYTESKKTASLSKSKSMDKSNSSKLDRSSGNSMNATPSK